MQHKQNKYIVVARTPSGGIGKGGAMPWHPVVGDLKWFKRLTLETRDVSKRNCLIVGARTYKTMPHTTDSRIICPVSHKDGPKISVLLDEIHKDAEIETIFFCGGVGVYEEAFAYADGIYITEMKHDAEGCDTLFPDIPDGVFGPPEVLPGSTNYYTLTFRKRLPHPEEQYLGLLRECLLAPPRDDRTGMGTRSVFGRTMRFDCRNGKIPVFTTKRVFWKGVVAELLWFLRGETDASILQKQGVRIWDANASREFLDKQGFMDRSEGQLGPVYGFQWRHFGADWPNTVNGVDQISSILTQLRTNPTSRRMLVSAWNPKDLPKCALPPCHVLFQFWVEDGEVSCSMYQRSADMGLGVPFNVASYALLLHIVARATNLKPGDFFHVMGDTHVYSEHEEAIKEQVTRVPRPFPTLRINTDNTDPFEYKTDDFELVGYDPHASLKMKMAV